MGDVADPNRCGRRLFSASAAARWLAGPPPTYGGRRRVFWSQTCFVASSAGGGRWLYRSLPAHALRCLLLALHAGTAGAPTGPSGWARLPGVGRTILAAAAAFSAAADVTYVVRRGGAGAGAGAGTLPAVRTALARSPARAGRPPSLPQPSQSTLTQPSPTRKWYRLRGLRLGPRAAGGYHGAGLISPGGAYVCIPAQAKKAYALTPQAAGRSHARAARLQARIALRLAGPRRAKATGPAVVTNWTRMHIICGHARECSRKTECRSPDPALGRSPD